MNGPEFPTDIEPKIGLASKFQIFTDLARRQFHQGRGGRAKLAISTSVASRIVSTAISLLVLPITVRYLGNEGYGLMVTISSVVGWLQFTNMGIGLGLQNALTEETARANRQSQKELVSTAIFSLAAIGVVLLGIGLVAFPFVDWLRIFPPTTSRFATEIPWSVLIVFLGFVSTIVLGFVGPIYAARQELHLGSIQAIIISLLTLIGTLTAVHFRWGLIGIVSSTIGVTALMQWGFALWTLYGRNIQELRPRLSDLSRPAWRRIYKTGLSFLLLQLCNIAFYGTDAFLITHFLSVDQVTPYSVAQKVFLQTAGIFAIITGSLWAAYGNAKALGDVAWIRRTHGKMVRLFFLFFGGLTIFMILFGHFLLVWWVGVAAAPTTLLIAGVAAYFSTREWTGLHAMLLNGLDVVRPQVPNLVITAVITLILDLLLVRPLGPLGLAVGGFFGFAIASGWYLPLLASRELAKPSRTTGSGGIQPA